MSPKFVLRNNEEHDIKEKGLLYIFVINFTCLTPVFSRTAHKAETTNYEILL